MTDSLLYSKVYFVELTLIYSFSDCKSIKYVRKGKIIREYFNEYPKEEFTSS